MKQFTEHRVNGDRGEHTLRPLAGEPRRDADSQRAGKDQRRLRQEIGQREEWSARAREDPSRQGAK